MINLLEASTVKATHHIALASGFAAALAFGAVSPLGAQGTRTITRDPNANAILVVTFRSPDKKLGAEAGEALRTRLPKDTPLKQLWVIPTADIKANLEPAGFKYEDPLSTNDARLLAQSFRAEEFVEGRVTNVAGNIRVNARMVSTNDAKMTQPLPQVEAKRLDHAMTQVSAHLKAARAQLPAERRCEGFVRERKFQEAITAARQAITAYPQSTLGRICLASAFSGLNYSPDSILPVVTQVLAIDSLNYHGLALAAGAYKAKGDSAKSTELLVTLLSTDPTNVTLQLSVANDIANTRQFDKARKIIRDALEANPGDPDLIKLNFQILVATEDWKEATQAGEDLIKSDTSATDTLFFPRLASAYKADSQPQKAAEAIARGLAKYPNNARFHLLHSQFLREAGQLQPSIDAARRAIQMNPNMPEAIIAYLTIAQTYLDLNQPDSIGPVLRTAAASAKTGQDSARVGSFAIQQGQRAFSTARADTADPARAVASREGLESSIRWFALADSLAASPAAKFQQGFAAFLAATSIANREIVPNAKTKLLNNEQICALGRLGQSYATMAQLSIQRGGGAYNPQAGGQIMTGAMGQSGYWDQVIKSACK
jgi:tetratricopeptide (TPR) repeat protein